MKHPLPIRSLLLALIALAVFLINPAYGGVESQTATPTAQAMPTRRTFSWPTVTPTPTAIASSQTTTQTTPTGMPVRPLVASPLVTATATATTTTIISGTVAPTSGSEISETVAISRPVRLRIPAIDVDAEIETVERDRYGRMDTPRKVEDVAWYAPGAAPGEIGNAVLAGHLDRIGGGPAVFWELGDLAVGDDIFVTDATGTEYHFRVTKQATYPYEEAPLDEIFGFAIRSHLNLITCRGKWEQGRQTYTQRLVVFSELVGSVFASR